MLGFTTKEQEPACAGFLIRADDETRTRDPHLGKVMRYQLRYIRVRDTGIEPVTSSVSGKRATAAPIAQCEVETGFEPA